MRVTVTMERVCGHFFRALFCFVPGRPAGIRRSMDSQVEARRLPCWYVNVDRDRMDGLYIDSSADS